MEEIEEGRSFQEIAVKFADLLDELIEKNKEEFKPIHVISGLIACSVSIATQCCDSMEQAKNTLRNALEATLDAMQKLQQSELE